MALMSGMLTDKRHHTFPCSFHIWHDARHGNVRSDVYFNVDFALAGPVVVFNVKLTWKCTSRLVSWHGGMDDMRAQGDRLAQAQWGPNDGSGDSGHLWYIHGGNGGAPTPIHLFMLISAHRLRLLHSTADGHPTPNTETLASSEDMSLTNSIQFSYWGWNSSEKSQQHNLLLLILRCL